jgi:PadR family transcriptional regulator
MDRLEPRVTLHVLRVLRVLVDRPRARHYGFEIVKRTGLPSGSVYPILDRLKRAGWLSGDWETIDPVIKGRPRRHFYRLTRHGSRQARRALDQAQASIAPH